MKISEQWLREWVSPPGDTQQLTEQLTMAGLEVDGVEPVCTICTGWNGDVEREVHAIASDARRLNVAGGNAEGGMRSGAVQVAAVIGAVEGDVAVNGPTLWQVHKELVWPEGTGAFVAQGAFDNHCSG